MKYTIKTLTIALALTIFSQPAFASSQSTVTMALGPSIGITHVMPITGGENNALVSEINVRLRALTILGLDFNYNLAGEKTLGKGEVYNSNYRLSALLYVIPTKVFSVYLLAGAGGSSLDNFNLDVANDKSYHGGAGLELYVGKHFALSTEFLMLIPAFSRVAISQQPLMLDEYGRVNMDSASGPNFGDYINAENFQVTFGLKYYF